MNNDHLLLDRMQGLVTHWEEGFDRRSIFLSCYTMMTRNMVIAVEKGEFKDSAWVLTLLHRFAEYYFDALDAFEQDREKSPEVWRLTFEASKQPKTHVLQHLILGVNAHICYDLIFALVDVLSHEWHTLTPEQIENRYHDHCHVNIVIRNTLDAVQDQVVERYSPKMDLIDKVLMSADEWIAQRFITAWREEVWQDATRLVKLAEAERQSVHDEIRQRAATRARSILGEKGILGVANLL
jgi:hypothetical protein